MFVLLFLTSFLSAFATTATTFPGLTEGVLGGEFVSSKAVSLSCIHGRSVRHPSNGRVFPGCDRFEVFGSNAWRAKTSGQPSACVVDHEILGDRTNEALVRPSMGFEISRKDTITICVSSAHPFPAARFRFVFLHEPHETNKNVGLTSRNPLWGDASAGLVSASPKSGRRLYGEVPAVTLHTPGDLTSPSSALKGNNGEEAEASSDRNAHNRRSHVNLTRCAPQSGYQTARGATDEPCGPCLSGAGSRRSPESITEGRA